MPRYAPSWGELRFITAKRTNWTFRASSSSSPRSLIGESHWATGSKSTLPALLLLGAQISATHILIARSTSAGRVSIEKVILSMQDSYSQLASGACHSREAHTLVTPSSSRVVISLMLLFAATPISHGRYFPIVRFSRRFPFSGTLSSQPLSQTSRIFAAQRSRRAGRFYL